MKSCYINLELISSMVIFNICLISANNPNVKSVVEMKIGPVISQAEYLHLHPFLTEQSRMKSLSISHDLNYGGIWAVLSFLNSFQLFPS